MALIVEQNVLNGACKPGHFRQFTTENLLQIFKVTNLAWEYRLFH